MQWTQRTMGYRQTTTTTPMPYFDSIAPEYDATFTDTMLGREKRAEVHRVLQGVPLDGMRVLELNCGTGQDAIFMARHGATVVATDISDGMLDIARQSAGRLGVESRIEFRRLPLDDLQKKNLLHELGRFDLVFSNFDGLNCIVDPGIPMIALADLLTEKGSAIFVYMPPVCAMEIVVNLLRLRFRRAFGRLVRDGIEVHIGKGLRMRTRFHSVRTVTRALPRGIDCRSVRAIGLFLPPTSMRRLYERCPRFFNGLERLTSPLRSFPPFNRMGDHVLLFIQRNRIPS